MEFDSRQEVGSGTITRVHLHFQPTTTDQIPAGINVVNLDGYGADFDEE